MSKLIVWFAVAILCCSVSADKHYVTWMVIPPALTRIQGQNVTLTWTVNVSTPLLLVEVLKDNNDVVFYNVQENTRSVRGDYVNRSADLNLTTYHNGSIWDITFTMHNLVKTTDEGEYKVHLTTKDDDVDLKRTTPLTIKVPPLITSSNPYTISTNETKTVQLDCNATGFPTPTINWTRNGVVVGTGSPFILVAKPEDHNQCYTCVAFNGVYDAQKANFCLTVQYHYNWTTLPTASLHKLYGESMRLVWVVDLSPTTFQSVTVWRTTNGISSPLITQFRNGSVVIEDKHLQNRSSDVIMRSIHSGSLVNITFEILYVIKSSDEAFYGASVTGLSGNIDVALSKTQLHINENVSWTGFPSLLSKLHGQDVSLNWTVNIASRKIKSVAVWRTKDNSRTQVITYSVVNNETAVQGSYASRASDLSLVVNNQRSIVYIHFRLLNLQSTDQAKYDASVTFESNITTVVLSKTQVIVDDTIVWNKVPSNLIRIQGQSMKLFWVINAPPPLLAAKVWRKLNLTLGHEDVAFYDVKTGQHEARGPYVNRSDHVNLTSTQVGSVMTFTFTLTNIDKGDEGEYDLTVTTQENIKGAPRLTKLIVNVPPAITSSHPYTIATNETKTFQLVCNTTGFPTPTINWTKNGVVVGTGSPFILVAKPEDHNQCYTCVAFNGVYDAQKANVCLTVQYKPRNATLTVDRSSVCQNDNVTLTCTSGPSNPAPSSYKFYYNDTLAQSSLSNVYRTSATHSSPYMNRFTCVPSNLLGDAVSNTTTNVRAKVPPSVTQRSNDIVVEEGSNLTLTCNVTGDMPLNVTWTTSGQHLSQGNIYRINNIKRKDGGVYRCTVTNGDECPAASEAINVTLKYSPVILNGNTVVSANLGSDAKLMCNVIGYPQPNINWTRNGTIIHSGNPYIKRNASMSDEGRCYTCVAFNDIGITSSNICLTIHYKPGSIKATANPSGGNICKPNTTVRMACNATAKPPAEYLWYLNNQLVQRNMDGQFSIQLNKTGQNALACLPNNSVGAGSDNHTVTFNVLDPPMILVQPRNVVLLQGQKLILHCNATGSPALDYQWKKISRSSGSLVGENETYTVNNVLIKDEGTYKCEVQNGQNCKMASISFNVTVNAPPNITSPQSQNLTVNEGERASLVCDATGKPTPNINWTRNGVLVHTGSPYNTSVLTYTDNGACYTCTVYNGIEQPKSAKICLNVQYKPRNATLKVNRLNVCQNDTVTLTCTSGPSNPAPSSYKFYFNDVLVQNTTSNVYISKAAHGLPDVNRFACVSNNFLGDSLNTGAINVTAKVRPSIVKKSQHSIIIEGTDLILWCNVSGTPPPNVTWTNAAGHHVHQGNMYRISNIRRSDEGVYRCTATNGDECSTASDTINVTVDYKPESTQFSMAPNNTRFCRTNSTTFTCRSRAKPPADYSLYRNNQLVQSRSSDGIFIVQLNETGNNNFICVPNNTAGEGERKTIQLFVADPPLIIVPPRDVVLVKGQPLTLFCNASGHPDPNITWYNVGGNMVGRGGTYTISTVSIEDEGSYRCVVNNGQECNTDSRIIANVTVDVPVNITTTNPQRPTVREGKATSLDCEATGKPTPNINWTRNGVIVHTGSPYNTSLLTHNDDGACYTCVAYNGVEDAKTVQFCLNVLYKPRNATLTVDRSSVCQNDTVTLTCTSGPSNPAPSGYMFYYNDVLVQNKSSNVYTNKAFNGLPGINRLTCVPSNLLGDAVENATRDVSAKVRPSIVNKSQHSIIIEGTGLILWCNVSGTPPPNVTWTNAAGHHVHQGNMYRISSIRRRDEGVYRCTATNGDECSTASDAINVTVNYKPESTTLIKSSSEIRFCKTNSTTFTCRSRAKPPAEYSLYRNNQLVQSRSSDGIFVVQLNQTGKNNFTCVTNNTAGEGERMTISLFVVDPPSTEILHRDVVIVEGQPLRLFCNVSGHPTPNVTWYKVGGTVVGRGEVLTISNTRRSHEGSYRCVASNGKECNTDSAVAKVTVNYAAVLLNSSQKYVTIPYNGSIRLICEGEGKPQPSITWTRNDNPDIIGRNSKLELAPADSLPGNYTCTIRNEVGSASHVSYVTVLACKKHNCVHGSCVAVGSIYSCNCVREYKGEHCDLHVCKKNLCQHGSICYSTASGYGCMCTRGLRGTYCELEDPLDNTFEVEMTISKREWRPEYENQESVQYKDLELKLCSQMTTTFVNLIDCEVVWFREGSIVSRLRLIFNETMTESEVLALLRNEAGNNTFGELEVKPLALKVMHHENPCRKEPCKFDGECQTKNGGFVCNCKHFRYGENCEKGIGLVAGIIIMVTIIFILLFAIFLLMAYFREKKTPKDSVDGYENGVKMRTIKYNYNDYMHSRSNAIYYLDEPTINEEKHVNGRCTHDALEPGSYALSYEI